MAEHCNCVYALMLLTCFCGLTMALRNSTRWLSITDFNGTFTIVPSNKIEIIPVRMNISLRFDAVQLLVLEGRISAPVNAFQEGGRKYSAGDCILIARNSQGVNSGVGCTNLTPVSWDKIIFVAPITTRKGLKLTYMAFLGVTTTTTVAPFFVSTTQTPKDANNSTTAIVVGVTLPLLAIAIAVVIYLRCIRKGHDDKTSKKSKNLDSYAGNQNTDYTYAENSIQRSNNAESHYGMVDNSIYHQTSSPPADKNDVISAQGQTNPAESNYGMVENSIYNTNAKVDLTHANAGDKTYFQYQENGTDHNYGLVHNSLYQSYSHENNTEKNV